MRKVIAFVMMIVFVLVFALPAFATDVMLEKKIERSILKKDKNGNPYAMLIVQDKATLKGISYEKGVPVMAFGDAFKKAKTLKKGDQLKAICQKRDYRGSTSYTVLQFVE
jgi:hypothetical protein